MEPFGGCLCVGCLEKQLGRKLKPKDFKRDHGFTPRHAGQSAAQEATEGRLKSPQLCLTFADQCPSTESMTLTRRRVNYVKPASWAL